MKAKTLAPKFPPQLSLYGFNAKGEVVHGIVNVNKKGKVPMAEVRKAMKASGMTVTAVWFFWPEPNEGRRWIQYSKYEHNNRWEKWPVRTNEVPEAVRTYAEWTY